MRTNSALTQRLRDLQQDLYQAQNHNLEVPAPNHDCG